MDIFRGWKDYVPRLQKNWNSVVKPEDTVVVIGDVSWAMSLAGAREDFSFINSELNGEKIILKGNHDYWWNTMSKIVAFAEENRFGNLRFLHNNAFLRENTIITGTRGWINDDGEPADAKVIAREAGRLTASIQAGKKLAAKSDSETADVAVFLHYPPVYGGNENPAILDVLRRERVKRVFYGHIHGAGGRARAFCGEKYGINFTLASADLVDFTPVRVE
jgi:predicted phosphohydrolase